MKSPFYPLVIFLAVLAGLRSVRIPVLVKQVHPGSLAATGSAVGVEVHVLGFL